jgi:iron complex outermembrane recepter protein
MKMIPAKNLPLLRLLSGLAALAMVASLRAQAPATATSTTTTTTTTTTSSDQSETSAAPAVTLDPFTVSTNKDRGYAATNEISGSRVDTPIKDIPITIDVITSEFISDIGATDLRSALAYQSGIMTISQNDIENQGGTLGGPYGPGGVNNPQGVTANTDQSQFKIRGFITGNTLRDGFLRLSGVDASNIDRIEVVFGPNALLYGTGNFGGVVDYLPRRPMDVQQGSASVSYGSDSFERAVLDVTGPVSTVNHIDYRLDASVEDSGSDVDYYHKRLVFVAPQLSWRPFDGTDLLADFEYGRENQSGNGFQTVRGVSSNSSALPVNNDQFEAVGFYFPPGSDPRSFNMSGPDTFVDDQDKNLELKGTQRILKETEFMPSVDLLVAYDRSDASEQQRQVNGLMEVDTDPSNNGFAIGETVITSQAANSIEGLGSNNGNLVFGTTPNSVIAYTWNTLNTQSTQDQERVELVLKKTMFTEKWYQWDSQVLAGYSDLYRVTYSNAGGSTGTNYTKPNNLNPILYGVQGDGSPDVPEAINASNATKNWDSAYYLNYYAKFFKDRVILMTGVRRDVNSSWDQDLLPVSPGVESSALTNKTYQNGIEVELTKSISVFALKADGVNPNFNGLRNASTGAPVSADTGKSNEYGIKFDFFKGKLTGTISRYTITKTSWVGMPFWAPAPDVTGNGPRFNPNKPIVYNLSDEDNPGQGMMPDGAVVGGMTWAASSDGPLSGAALAANLAAGGNGLNGGNNTGPSVTAFKAAVSAGSIYVSSAGIGTPQVYINASTPTGAAYLDSVFAANSQGGNGGWPGWMYAGMDAGPESPSNHDDSLLNNANMDANGFLNTGLGGAYQVVDQSKGYEGSILYTPNDEIQIVFNANVNATVTRINPGTLPEYPYTVDRWASWNFANFGLGEVPLNQAYTNPLQTDTHQTFVDPQDDTPKYSYSLFINYKPQRFKGITVGIGGNWHSQEQYYSGVSHGAGDVEGTLAGAQALIAYGPSIFTMDAFAKYDWKQWGYHQFVQANVYNLLDNKTLNGFLYTYPTTAKLTYGISF